NSTNANIHTSTLRLSIGYVHIAMCRLSMLIASLYVGLNIQSGRFSVEEFMVLIAYLNQLSGLLPGFGDAANRLFSSYADLKFVFNELGKPDEIIDLHPH